MRKLVFTALFQLLLLMIAVPVSAGMTGKCGDTATWSLSDDMDTLTIEGSGPMYDYGAVTPGWQAYTVDFTKVVVKQGVTRIGSNAFIAARNLKNVKLCNSLVSIGESAFEECATLTGINLGPVQFIGKDAFNGCTGLNSISFSARLRKIQDRAFASCTGLKTVTFPVGTQEIRVNAFIGCTALKDVYFETSTTVIGYYALGYTLDCKKIKGFVIHGSKGTTAEAYAASHGFAFRSQLAEAIVLEQEGFPVYTGAPVTYEFSLRAAGEILTEGVDYTTSYQNNIDACDDKARVFIEGKGSYEGKLELSFSIEPFDLGDADLVPSKVNYLYTGTPRRPTVTVSNGSSVIPKANYILSWANNTEVGKATVTVTATGSNCTGKNSVGFRISKYKLKGEEVTLAKTSVEYNGKTQKPAVTVMAGTKKLTAGAEYSVTYTANRDVGIAKAVVTGKGNYTGTVTKTFTIRPKPTKFRSLTPVSGGFRAMWWKKAGQTTGYQLQCSSKSDFSADRKLITIPDTARVVRTVTGLKSKTAWYTRVRTYRKVGEKKIFSTWSDTAKIVTN